MLFRSNLRLTKAGCATQFISAQKANIETSLQLMHCQSCSIGEVNAGIKATPVLPKICVRCEHNSFRRLCGKLLCLSCYNRAREKVIGRNARGSTPIRFIPLHIFDYADSLIVVGRDKPEALRVVNAMTGNNSLKPEKLIDYGVATPSEINHWWRAIVLPWSAKRTNRASIKI